MKTKTWARLIASGAALAAGTYGAWAARNWWRYGRPTPPRPDERDDLLDCFIPRYDVVERHRIYVGADAATTLAAAKEQQLFDVAAIRAIFKTRELVMGSTPDTRVLPAGLLASVKALGWGVLAERPDREIVIGAVTRPWDANVVFHALAADEFKAFSTPGFVKIVWTLRADELGNGASLFRTETRAVATDADSRARFRNYWALVSPGIEMIRQLSLGPLKREAERRARGDSAAQPVPITH